MSVSFLPFRPDCPERTIYPNVDCRYQNKNESTVEHLLCGELLSVLCDFFFHRMITHSSNSNNLTNEKQSRL